VVIQANFILSWEPGKMWGKSYLFSVHLTLNVGCFTDKTTIDKSKIFMLENL
jgi:hypothetical protein